MIPEPTHNATPTPDFHSLSHAELIAQAQVWGAKLSEAIRDCDARFMMDPRHCLLCPHYHASHFDDGDTAYCLESECGCSYPAFVGEPAPGSP